MHRSYRAHRSFTMQRYSWLVASPTQSDLVLVFKALANPTRLQILTWLKDPITHFEAQDQPAEEVGVCVKQIQAKAGISQSTASTFMASMQRVGLVESRRIGQWTYYKRDEARIRQLAEQLGSSL